MSNKKTTLISHMYNEEYLLPFWLNHHKNMFDDIIIIDYRSTDNSIEICKKICPNIIIIKTKNPSFDLNFADIEIMNLESSIEGIKVVLNTTEFLFTEKPIKEYFSDNKNPLSISVTQNSPYSKNRYENINTNYELFLNLLNDDVVFNQDRQGKRYIHNFPHGNYFVGRHFTRNPTIESTGMYIIWFGFFPLNEKLLKRKLQIGQFIPEHDRIVDNGIQHFWSKEKMLEVNEEGTNIGVPLKILNTELYNHLLDKYLAIED